MKGFNYFLCLMLILSGYISQGQEICNNGKDDDGDGLIDLHDPDCQCHFEATGNLLQNASFESYNSCPTNHSFDNDSKIVDFWQYGTYTNGNGADYYHNLNCLYDSSQVMLYLPPSLPLPDGKAFISIRQYVYRKPNLTEKDIAKVYAGQCLASPLKPGKQYTFSFSAARFKSHDDTNFRFKNTPFTVAIFGHADCNAVPFGEPYAYSNGCPANYPGWVLLGKTVVYGKGKWVQSRIDFTVPTDINVIETGPDCSILNPGLDLADSTTILDFYVYDLDDLRLLPTKDFHFQTVENENGNRCTNDSVLKAPDFLNATYQWYKDSISITGETKDTYKLPVINSPGNYNVRIVTAGSCVVSEPFIAGLNELLNLTVPKDTSLCANDSIVLAPKLNGVTYNLNGSLSSIIKISKPGIYTITATDINDCSKEYVVNVRAQNCAFYVPNSFTPNVDGVNDVFRIPQGLKIQLTEFSVFDRWGNKVFSTVNGNTGWDGSYKGKECSGGAYAYIIKGLINNKKQLIKGTVSLIR